MDVFERIEDQDTGYYAELFYDTDPESPREWSNIGTMVCAHKRYNLGDVHISNSEDLEKFHSNLDELKNLILPLYLYDHSGITMSTKPFSCPWDSGQVGVIYVSHENIKKEWGELTPETLKKAEDCLKAEVDVYDEYITGQVYGYRICNSDGEDLESLHGIFGRDHLEKEAKAELEHYVKNHSEPVFTSVR